MKVCVALVIHYLHAWESGLVCLVFGSHLARLIIKSALFLLILNCADVCNAGLQHSSQAKSFWRESTLYWWVRCCYLER